MNFQSHQILQPNFFCQGFLSQSSNCLNITDFTATQCLSPPYASISSSKLLERSLLRQKTGTDGDKIETKVMDLQINKIGLKQEFNTFSSKISSEEWAKYTKHNIDIYFYHFKT